MRAVQIKTFGEPGIVLELADLPEPPAPAAGPVLIGVEHAPINMTDLYLIQGVYPVRPSLPSIVGNERAGRVLAIGRGVDHLKVGDRVLVPLYSFSWRERPVAPAARLSALPEADPRQLAMLGINPPTAALLLSEIHRPQARRLGRAECRELGRGPGTHRHCQGARPQDDQLCSPPRAYSRAASRRRRPCDRRSAGGAREDSRNDRRCPRATRHRWGRRKGQRNHGRRFSANPERSWSMR
jgi:hypothetical protein